MGISYLDHIVADSARFAAQLAVTPPARRVPSCPDWDADDLLWHLGEVQWFWATVVRDRLTDAAAARGLTANRPDGHDALLAFFDAASRELVEALSTTPPDTPVWTWSSDRTAGFVLRRQAHEAPVHRVDAELTSGERTAMDAELAADGLDEALRVMYGFAPSWGEFTPSAGSTVRVRATDGAGSWQLTLGRFSGTDPDPDGHGELSGVRDLRVAEVDDGAPAAATVSGTAEDLDCWFWNREPFGQVVLTGDEAVLAELAATTSDGIS